MPSCTQRIASLIIGISTRLDTNPGASCTTTGVFPSCFANATVRSTVSLDVSCPRITSTSGITGTGFMKCMPTTRAELLVCLASSVMEMDEVLLARIVSGGGRRRRAAKTSNFTFGFSDTASTTISASFAASRAMLVEIRARTPARCASAGRNPCQDSRPLRVAHRALLDLALQILLDRLESAAERILGDVDQHRIPSVLREDVRDAVAHRTGAHHGDFAHAATAWVSGVRCLVNTFLLVNRNSVPAVSATVATTPPSGPNVPPSIQRCRPGVYSTTGTWNMYPETGASNRIASPAFHPTCAPQASGIPPAAYNATHNHNATQNMLSD